MAIPAAQVRVLNVDEDVEEFPFRFAALLCDDSRNYHKTSIKHHLNRIWTINSPYFKLAKPYVQELGIQNLFVVMFKKSQDRDSTFLARPTLLFGQLFAVQPLGNLESIFDLVWDKTLMHVQIPIHSDLVNKGRAREVLDQLGTFVSADSPVGNLYEAKLMVPLRYPLTRKVVINTSTRPYYMTVFYPKLPFLACKKCFILYHNEDNCREIRMRIFVRALPAPSPRATHVSVTNVHSSSEDGECSNAGKANSVVAADAVSDEHSKPSGFSVSLHPSAALRNTGSSSFSPVFPSDKPRNSPLTIRELVSSQPNSVGFPSSFEDMSFDVDGLLHD
ncbi:uncharacterized protein LOC113342157 [Papaver somniferum]|uniref:uncharacterized protein LOC113342157 n=1 Tax=Papaver somniferum TaxID=3469 RepID=UPI000E6FF24C|nr:uncharacterized protein LOC113342157 [Papaver somniferum]